MPLDFPIRKTLATKQRASGAWLTLPSTAIARTLASTPGISWVLVDGEHGQITDSAYYDLNNAIAACGASPIVRIPADEGWMIKRALDSGAHGIMVPLANSVDLVRKVVSAAKYPPNGTRGFGPMFTHAAGALGASYRAQADDAVLVAVQIEHPDAVRDVEAIVNEGIDVAFIGPFDLAVSMGVEFGGDEHEAAIRRVLDATHAAGKAAAIFCMDGDQAARRFEQGFDMVSIATDIDTLVFGFAEHAAKAGAGTGEVKASYGT